MQKQMKTSFLIMALRCLSDTIANLIDRSVVGAKFLLRDQVIAFSELTSRFNWLKLSTENYLVTDIKNTEPLDKLLFELKELVKSYPELEGVDFKSGDPFFSLVQKRGLTADEILQMHGKNAICISVDSLTGVSETIMSYNYFYKYRKLFPSEFRSVEDQMSVLAKAGKWPGRGSWNSFVPKKDKPKKKKRDFSRILSEFGIPSSPTVEEPSPNA